MKVLKFPISSSIIKLSNGIVDIFTPDYSLYYLGIPFCPLPPISNNYQEMYAALCTEITSMPSNNIIKWLTFHISQGFSHVFLYVNDNSLDKMKYDLFWAIKAGFVTIIDWNWPKIKKFQDQVPGLTSCLYRTKRRFKWVGFNDVDEYFAPKYNETVIDILKKHELNRPLIGSLAAPNRFFIKSTELSTVQLCSMETKPPFRQKIIVNPDNVDLIHVHKISQGKIGITLNELINAHFKSFIYLAKYKIFKLSLCPIPKPNLVNLNKILKLS